MQTLQKYQVNHLTTLLNDGCFSFPNVYLMMYLDLFQQCTLVYSAILL